MKVKLYVDLPPYWHTMPGSWPVNASVNPSTILPTDWRRVAIECDLPEFPEVQAVVGEAQYEAARGDGR